MRVVASAVETYPAGSIVLCQHCLKPLYRLERGIGMGERAGRAAEAFKPVRPSDLAPLVDAIDPSVSAMARSWTAADVSEHCRQIPDVVSGAPMLCPCCGHSFPVVQAKEAGEVLDLAYVVELVTIPPGRMLSGREARAWTR